jgi:hypothetical protein
MEMMREKITLSVCALMMLCGCITREVRQVDIDAWTNVSVVALDTHSVFITMPQVRTVSDDGLEIRDYIDKVGVSNCMGTGAGFGGFGRGYMLNYANFNSFQTCSAQSVGCDNIFYIRDGKVLEYKPVGLCNTNQTLQPEAGWEKFLK